MKTILYLLFFIILCSLTLPRNSTAEENPWQFEVIPYFWGIGFAGTSSVGGLPALDVDLGATDVFGNFNGGLALFAAVRKGDWSIIMEGTYLSLEQTDDVLLGESSQKMDTYLLMSAAAYRLPVAIPLDIYAGFRFTRLDIGVEYNGSSIIAGDTDWVDPLVGIRMSLPVTEKFAFNLIADVGGFGVGSDFAYSIMPVLHYQFSEMISGDLAYRWLDMDYDNDSFAMDMLISGPMLGVSFEW